MHMCMCLRQSALSTSKTRSRGQSDARKRKQEESGLFLMQARAADIRWRSVKRTNLRTPVFNPARNALREVMHPFIVLCKEVAVL